MATAINEIKALLVEAFTSESSVVASNAFQQLAIKLDSYLSRLNNFYEGIERSVNDVVSTTAQIDASPEYVNYAIFRKLTYEQSEVDSLLKEGYVLIDELRHFFTGETIKYQIGVEYYGNLYEFEMSMEQLLSYTSAVYNTRSKVDNMFKLRMNVGKGDLIKAYVDSRSTVVSSLKGQTVYGVLSKQIRAIKANRGNAYEAYRVYISLHGNKIPPEVDLEEFTSILEEVRMNTASSVKGGDLGDTQIKLFAKSAPSLMTTNTIRITLQEVVNMFKSYSAGGGAGKLRSAIKATFTKNVGVDGGAKAVDIALEKEIDKHLDKLLQKLSR